MVGHCFVITETSTQQIFADNKWQTEVVNNKALLLFKSTQLMATSTSTSQYSFFYVKLGLEHPLFAYLEIATETFLGKTKPRTFSFTYLEIVTSTVQGSRFFRKN